MKQLEWNSGEIFEGLKDMPCEIPPESEIVEPHIFNRTGIPHTDEMKEDARHKAAQWWAENKDTEKAIARNKKIGDALRGRKRPQHTIDNVTKGLCKNTYRLIHESGEVVVTDNLAAFCRERKLHPHRMKERVTGQKVKLYHGWTGQIL